VEERWLHIGEEIPMVRQIKQRSPKSKLMACQKIGFTVVELHQSLLKVQPFTWQEQLMSLTLVMYLFTGKIKFSMSFL
jgi:hypothetical protein